MGGGEKDPNNKRGCAGYESEMDSNDECSFSGGADESEEEDALSNQAKRRRKNYYCEGKKNPPPKRGGANYESEMDSDDDSTFSGEGDKSEEDDVAPEQAFDRSDLQFELGRRAINEDIIYYDKTFELCCFHCPCKNEDHNRQVRAL